MDEREVRATLMRAAAARGLSLSGLSASIRRNPSYLQQFVARGSPRVLAERDRRVLAAVLDLPESALGASDDRPVAVAVPRLAVEASAGPGANVEGEERTGEALLDAALARTLGLVGNNAAVIQVRGASMEPGLRDGDEVVVDTADRTPGRAARVYVVRVDGSVMIKRVSRGRSGLVILSDNPAADSVPPGEVEVIGRAVWRMGSPLT